MSKSLNLLAGALPAQGVKPLRPFAEGALAFLAELSGALLRDKAAKAYPDVVTFAFFCRRAGLMNLRREYEGQLDDRLGRGVCFHIAPGNVPVNFAYSLVAALLAGNASIVKASSKDFPQTEIICRALNGLLATEAHAWLAPYVCVVTYPREEQELTEGFSAACDVRVIWGGDETVRRVREAPLPPRAFDVTFPDRYSLLCLGARALLEADQRELDALAQGFYNDTYLTDQNACTSPRLVYWVGESADIQAGKKRFWNAVYAYAALRYPVEPVIAVDKLTAACRAAIGLEGARMEREYASLAVRVQVAELVPGVEAYRCPGGFFLEHESQDLNDLIPLVGPKYQTLSYFGLAPEALCAWVTDNALRGIDRIVPLGHTMDFALTWDGYDLIRTLSRRIAVI